MKQNKNIMKNLDDVLMLFLQSKIISALVVALANCSPRLFYSTKQVAETMNVRGSYVEPTGAAFNAGGSTQKDVELRIHLKEESGVDSYFYRLEC